MRLYLDSMIWIYALESHPELGLGAQALLRRINLEGHTVITSYLLLAEVLILPIRKSDLFSIAMYKRAVLKNPNGQIVTFGADAAMAFAHLRAEHRVKSPDAMHLALAASTKVDAFITSDTRLLNLTVPGIGTINDATNAFL